LVVAKSPLPIDQRELSATRSYPETGFEEVGRISDDKSACWKLCSRLRIAGNSEVMLFCITGYRNPVRHLRRVLGASRPIWSKVVPREMMLRQPVHEPRQRLHQIVVNDHDGEQHQENKRGLVDAFFNAQADIAPHEPFDEKE
jgi:hypothetical protein